MSTNNVERMKRKAELRTKRGRTFLVARTRTAEERRADPRARARRQGGAEKPNRRDESPSSSPTSSKTPNSRSLTIG